MKINYTKNGDYYIPNIKTQQTEDPLGHYGRLRKVYLQQSNPMLFNELLLSGKLYEHCSEIEKTAKIRFDIIMSELMKQYNIDEKLKANNQMEWVRQMNACKAQAEEIIKNELIYN